MTNQEKLNEFMDIHNENGLCPHCKCDWENTQFWYKYQEHHFDAKNDYIQIKHECLEDEAGIGGQIVRVADVDFESGRIN